MDQGVFNQVSEPKYLFLARPQGRRHQHKPVHQLRVIHRQPRGDRGAIAHANQNDRMMSLLQTVQY
jgi:hypothetical protein